MILQCKTDDFFFDGKKENEWNYWNRGNLQVQWRGCILCDLYFYETGKIADISPQAVFHGKTVQCRAHPDSLHDPA